MIKREEADSGLRAGFIREDEAKKRLSQQAELEAQEALKEEVLASSEPPEQEKPKAEEKSEDKPEKEKPEGPKVSVQGISGRMITGTIRVVKKADRKKNEEEQEADTKASKAAETSPKQVKEKEPASKETVTTAEKAAAKDEVKKAEPSKPAATVEKPAEKAEEKASKAPEKQAVEPKKTEKKVAEKSKAVEKITEAPASEKAKPEADKAADPVEKAAESVAEKEKAPVRKEEKKEAPPVKEKKAETEQKEAKEEKVQDSPKAKEVKDSKEVNEAKESKEDIEEKEVERPRGPINFHQLKPGETIKTSSPPKSRAQKIVKPAEDRPLSYTERTGKEPIRAQKGSYLGKQADTPAFREQSPRGRRDDRGGNFRDNRGGGGGFRDNRSGGGFRDNRGGGGFRDNRGGGGGFRDNRGGRPGFRDNRGGKGGFRDNRGFDFQDKDAEEAPRRTRSPKPQKAEDRFAAPIIPDKKVASRRNFAEQKNHRDKKRYDDNFSDGEKNIDKLEFRPQRRSTSQAAQLTNVKLPAAMTVKELAETLKKTSADVIMKLMGYGVMATVNQEIDYDTAEVIAGEFGIKAEQIIEVTEEEILFDDSEDDEDDENLVKRPPVVVVMGHVDHGKTSILDWIRNAKVASGEAGGITQHIGAYTVDVKNNKLTFLDTPGHEAFTAMRARGAKVTDIAILVVAADDGVMPQTIEAINHAKAADTEIIIAINKIDRPTANIDRVKQELAQHGILAPDWGGDVTMVAVSAKTGENMEELLEMVQLTAEIMELKANPDRQAKGTVIEGRLDRSRGAVATVLVQRGTLRLGDQVVVGSMIGNIRAMTDDSGDPIEEAGPSIPVEILGLPDVPEDGEIFYVVENEKVAKSLVERRQEEERERMLKKTSKVSLDNLFDKLSEGETKDLNIIIKADVMGSVEALTQSLEKLSNDEVKLSVIHGAVGAVTESDVRLADVSDAIIIGFNVRPAANVKEMAKDANVDIRLYRVIYEAIEEMESAMKGMLEPTFEEEVLGHAEVRETYKVSGVGTIAGCYVTDGKIMRNAELRIVRDGIVVHEGQLASLKRFKDDAREVAAGYECGISIDKFNDIKVGDVFEMFHMKEMEREL